MERFSRRKAHARVSSPMTTVVDRSSGDRPVTIHWKGGQNNLTKSASHSNSSSSRALQEEDLLTVDQVRRSSHSAAGTPMKQLLTDEMSKGTESRRRSPSIIARLMGLDGLPAQQNTNKQPKRVVHDNHRHNTGSSGSRKSSKPSDSRMHKKDSRGRHVFKDVYEVVESPDMEISNRTSHGTFSPSPSEDEIAYVRQKFMDVKRFSTDERFQNTKEFRDALDVLYSNKDLLLKFLQEPNSLFAKHLRDLHGVPESHCGHVSSMKSANNLKCNIDTIGCHSGGEASRKIDISHSRKRRDNNLRHSHGHNVDSHNVNFLAEDKLVPTRIVVLKPNLGKVQTNARSVSSPSPSRGSISDHDLHEEHPYIMHSATEMRGKRIMNKDCDVYECKHREYRELARDITRRMKNKLGADSFNVSLSGYKGYSADESSRDMSENDSSYESEVTSASSRTSNSKSVCNKASTLHHEESSVSKEAKRRLSERWKMTYRSQEVGASGKGSTLADMLAVPDSDIRPRKLDEIVVQDECIRSFERKEGPVELISPLGISSRDGWKDGCIRNLSKSRSLPSSSTQLLTPKSSTRRETLATERFLVRKESIDQERSKSLKRESKRNGGSFSESPRSNNKKPDFSYPVSMELIDGIQEVHLSKSMMSKSFDVKDSPDELKTIVFELSPGRYDTNLVTNPMMDQEYKNVSGSLNCPDEPSTQPHRSSNDPSQDDSSTCDMPLAQQEPSTNYDVARSSSLLCTATQPESPASSKESEQPSPVSVLEAAFVEDTSSGSECFERVSAELHGLRMQLQLLKLESDTYDEGSMAISSDEDGEDSTESHDRKGFLGAGESWASSYLDEVLNESGLDETNPDLFMSTWHSPDCSISPRVFENLERKYDGNDSCSKLERKQLFDCLNSRIIQISQQFVNLHPWVPSLTTNVCSSYALPQWWKNGLRTELKKLLEVHEKKVREIPTDEEILGCMLLPWMEIGEYIDAIGRDFEVLLIDELVAEVIM